MISVRPAKTQITWKMAHQARRYVIMDICTRAIVELRICCNGYCDIVSRICCYGYCHCDSVLITPRVCCSGLSHCHLSLLSHWTDPGLRSRMDVQELISTLKKKEAQTGIDSSKIFSQNACMQGKSHHHPVDLEAHHGISSIKGMSLMLRRHTMAIVASRVCR